ncbi:MAG TPA: twin-arginine translocase subunit TatC [Alphaproteobacteria bacterium]|nr:twin-arginine translocase subunit TatC [Alphaproteobacteria bacterium]HAJ45330.1 twin-arginine translocase subunit TatC [Alphaproteobacteria bacterium]
MLAFIIAFFASYAFAKPIYQFLAAPLAQALEGEAGRRMIATGVMETFFTYIRVAAFSATCLSFPVVASQVWMFIAPGLYKHERKAFLPFLIATPVMFTAGAALAYYGLLPVAMEFFLSFETPAGEGALPIQLEARVSEYLSFIMTLIFAFGLAFQVPVGLTLMGRVGIIDSAWLMKYRRYAIVMAFVIAAVITPPDVMSQVALAVPLILLYEVSIWIVRMFERERAREAAAREAAAE